MNPTGACGGRGNDKNSPSLCARSWQPQCFVRLYIFFATLSRSSPSFHFVVAAKLLLTLFLPGGEENGDEVLSRLAEPYDVDRNAYASGIDIGEFRRLSTVYFFVFVYVVCFRNLNVCGVYATGIWRDYKVNS